MGALSTSPIAMRHSLVNHRAAQLALSALLSFSIICPSHAATPGKAELAGPWCFYQQSGMGSVIPEQVNISLHADGRYDWREGPFEQKGTWTVEKDVLSMTQVGQHRIVKLEGNELQLQRGSLMYFRKGSCAPGFSDQDIIRFQNAASTGDEAGLAAALASGIDIDVIDFRTDDSALIKAAKFCRPGIVKTLLARGANKALKSAENKTALDYARESRFHKGCPELVKALE